MEQIFPSSKGLVEVLKDPENGTSKLTLFNIADRSIQSLEHGEERWGVCLFSAYSMDEFVRAYYEVRG